MRRRELTWKARHALARQKWVVQMASNRTSDAEFRPISPVRAALLRIWGPADSWDNPLTGTRYDPALAAERQHKSLEVRRLRWQRRKSHWQELTHRHHGR